MLRMFVRQALAFIGLMLLLGLLITLLGCDGGSPIEQDIARHMLIGYWGEDKGARIYEARHSNTELYEVAKSLGDYKESDLYGWGYGKVISDATFKCFSWYPFRHNGIGVAYSKTYSEKYEAGHSEQLYNCLLYTSPSPRDS